MTVDWKALFVPDVSLLEMFVRGTVVYLGLFVLLRLILKREVGGVGVTDVLVVVLIADAAQDAMASNYNSITSGMMLVSTILFWDYAIAWLSFHSPTIRRLVHPPPLLLVKDGELIARNMRHELITREELMTQLREQGIAEVSQVKRAFMEENGRISAVRREADA